MKAEKSLLRTLRNKIKVCPVCLTERMNTSLCDVPADLIQKAKMTEIVDNIEIDYYLYCPKCKKYSVIYCAYSAWA